VLKSWHIDLLHAVQKNRKSNKEKAKEKKKEENDIAQKKLSRWSQTSRQYHFFYI